MNQYSTHQVLILYRVIILLCFLWFHGPGSKSFLHLSSDTLAVASFCSPSRSVTSLLCPHPECQSPSVCCCCVIPSVLFKFFICHFYSWFSFAAPSLCFYQALSFRVMFSRLLQEIASSQKPAHVPLLYFTACLLPCHTKQLSDRPAMALSHLAFVVFCIRELVFRKIWMLNSCVKIMVLSFIPFFFFFIFQMASTAFLLSAFFVSSSSPRTCWAAASPSVSRTCPRSTSCPHSWATSWRACQRCFQCLSKMFSSSTSSPIWMQRRGGSWMSASLPLCQAGSSSRLKPWRSSCT